MAGRGRQQESRDKLNRERVAEFFADPRAAYPKAYTRSEEFGWLLLYTVKEEVNHNPSAGRAMAEEALGLFRWLEKKGSIEVQRRTRCMATTALCLLAAADRRLGFSKTAESQLHLAHVEATQSGCLSCQAEILRRKSLLAATAGKADVAEFLVRQAVHFNRTLEVDHNLDKNGLAAALLAHETVLFLAGRCEDALVLALETIRACDPAKSPTLYRYALHNLAVDCLEVGTPETFVLAERRLEEASGYFRGWNRGPNAERAHLLFLRGQIKVRRGVLQGGRALMAKALGDFLACKMPRESVIVAAEIVRFHVLAGSAWEAEHALTDLTVSEAGQRVWHRTLAELSCEVLRELRSTVRLAMKGDLDRMLAPLSRVRELVQADEVMPCLI